MPSLRVFVYIYVCVCINVCHVCVSECMCVFFALGVYMSVSLYTGICCWGSGFLSSSRFHSTVENEV